MTSKTLTSEMQRRFLLLARYLQALESGELEIASKILQAAEQDEVLERMIVEANVLYQTTPSGENLSAELAEADLRLVTSYLAQLETDHIRRDPHQSRQGSRTPLPMVKPQREQRSRQIHRLMSGLAAVLLGVLLVGGFLAFITISHSTTPSAPGTGIPSEKRLTLMNGWRLEQIAEQTATLGLSNFHTQEFLNYTHHPSLFPDAAKYPMLQHAPSMEGLLYPATYQIPANANTVQVIDMMLNELTQVLRQNTLVALAQQHKLTEYQMLILASIIQREANRIGSMPLIAGIYWNRIYRPSADVGGPYLSADPTVEYAYDTDNPPVPPAKYWVDLNNRGIGVDVDPNSPWNTYTHPGWPPTPISSPSLAALQAAASPTPTNCYYFLFKPADGSVVCAQTYAQFQQLANEYFGK